jgi:NB-ARC domain-containing protein
MSRLITIALYYQVPPAAFAFIGREDEIAEIENALPFPENKQNRSIGIWGLANMGKTTLAVEYTEKYSTKYRTIKHFNARSELDLITGMERFFDFLIDKHDERLEHSANQNTTAKVDAVIKWFEEEPRWLLIYDNIDLSLFTDFARYIPQHSLGHRIMISRRPEIGRYTRKVMELKAMPPCQSVPMLLERSNAQKSPNHNEETSVERQIVTELGGMPGFIEAAAMLILQNEYSLQQYLQLLKNKKANMRVGNQGALPGDATASLELNLDSVRRQKSSMSLLCLFSFLDGTELSYEGL